MSHKVSSCEVLVAGGGIFCVPCARAPPPPGLPALVSAPRPPPPPAAAPSAARRRPRNQALRADAQRCGAHTLNARVQRLNTILGRATGVETSAGKIKAEHVVIAAGAWSPQIEHLPRRLAVEPVRGQMAAAPWPGNMPRTVLYYDHGYVVARSGEAIFGSTMERVGFDGSVTTAGNAENMAAPRRVLPQ